MESINGAVEEMLFAGLPRYTHRQTQGLAAACAAHARLGPATLLLYDVTTLYFETDKADGFREPGSPRSAASNRRSPSGCSQTTPGSR